MTLEELINIENIVQVILAEMEVNGIYCDRRYLEKTLEIVETKAKKIEEEIYLQAGKKFNILSVKELSIVMFEELGLPTFRKNKTGYSTDESVLKKLAIQHEFPNLILQYRHLKKLMSTYLKGLISHVNHLDSCIHSSFLQKTSTGRISSKNPNLQNLPADEDFGPLIKKAFTPRKSDFIFVSFDYSQIELRIFAHIANEQSMISSFNSSEDIHVSTAKVVFNKEDISKTERNFAKTINFGILYGMEAYGLSQALNISMEEAKHFLSIYFKNFPKIQEYFEKIKGELETREFVETIYGRKRYFLNYKTANNILKKRLLREAINMPIQGTSADINKTAMCRIREYLHSKNLQYDISIVLVVHDEIILEGNKNILNNKIAEEVRNIMESVVSLSVPLSVNYKIGDNLSFL